LRQQAVTTGHVDNPPAPETPADPAGALPTLKQLLAGQAPGVANSPADGVEQRGASKLRQVPFVETVARRGIQGRSLGTSPVLVEQRSEETVEGHFLLGGKQVKISLVIQQKDADADHGPRQIAGAIHLFLNPVSVLGDQVFQQFQVDLHEYPSLGQNFFNRMI